MLAQTLIGVVLASGPIASQAMAQPCGEWASVFPSGNLFGPPRSWAEFDDGTGKALYAGGSFMWPDWQDKQSVLRYRNGRWEDFGTLRTGLVSSLVVFDDGAGDQLYAAYEATTGVLPGVSRWNGANWERIAQCDGPVTELAVYGGDLYAAGDFQTTEGIATARIAKWDGKDWSAVGPGIKGINGPVHALVVFDDGTGSSLYAGGEFRIAGTTEAWAIARWDGTLWHPLGRGVHFSSRGGVFALGVHDDGSGSALYVGGKFSAAGLVPAADGVGYLPSTKRTPDTDGIARWDGQNWSSVGGGLRSTVYAIGEYLGEGSVDLYVGETGRTGFTRWDGNRWTAVGGSKALSGSNSLVSSMIVYDDGEGDVLFAAGNIDWAGDLQANGVVMWDGASWEIPQQGFFETVQYFAQVEEVGGPALYVGGQFLSAGNVASKYVVKWDGGEWSGLDGGTNDRISSLAMFDDGTGQALYATGRFTEAGGVPVNHIAKWDGLGWQPLGPGLNAQGSRLYVFDDGNGPALYVGGTFTVAGLVTANGVAKWNGLFWSSVGASISTSITAMTAYDDGSGEALYVAAVIGGAPASTTIHRWDGATWTVLPVGSINGSVEAMTAWDDGSGSSLYLGGNFTAIGGAALRGIARWDGSQVTSLGSGMTRSSGQARVFALGVYDDGSGACLYAGGLFSGAGGTATGDIAKWNGQTWSGLGGGARNGGVNVLGTFDLGRGSSLYAGGGFRAMSRVSSDHIARLDPGHCGCYADCDRSTGIGVLDIFDFLCFQSEFVAGSSFACDCDVSTGRGICDLFDFLCFQDAFVAGCP
jgi:hypothetical protein